MNKTVVLRASLGAAFGLCLVAFACVKGIRHFGGRAETPPTDDEKRTTDVSAIWRRLLRLEEALSRNQSGRATGKRDPVNEETIGDPDQASPEVQADLDSKLSTIEQRLAGLEEDPLRRGYAFLVSESPGLRREGVNTLKRVARFDPEARTAIRRLLQDPDPKVREQAAQAIGDLRDKDSGPEMIALLADSDSSVRRRAVQALGALRPPHLRLIRIGLERRSLCYRAGV